MLLLRSTRRRLVPGDALLLGFAESLAGMALRLSVTAAREGHRRRPATRRWPGRSGTARPGSRPIVYSDSTGGLNRPGEIVLLVGDEHEPLTLRTTGATGCGSACCRRSPASRPTRSRRGSRTSQVAEPSAAPVRPSTRSTSRPSARALRRQPGQEFRSSRVRRSCRAERDGETVRITDSDGRVEWTEVEDFSRPVRTTTTSCGTRRPAVVRFGPRIRYPDGSVRQHGAIPRDGAEIAVTGYRYGGGAAGNVGARTLTAAAAAGAVHRRRGQPAGRDRRGRRGDGAGGQGPRPAHAAHRRAGGHRR